jgi:hypothetical protein
MLNKQHIKLRHPFIFALLFRYWRAQRSHLPAMKIARWRQIPEINSLLLLATSASGAASQKKELPQPSGKRCVTTPSRVYCAGNRLRSLLNSR